MSAKKKPAKQRNGKLKIELEFDDALRAALETKPPSRKKTSPTADPRRLPHPKKEQNGE